MTDDDPSGPGWSSPPSGAPLGPAPTVPVLPGGDPDTAVRFAVPESDRYEEAGLLGRGGMGEVRLAHDVRLGRDVAIKTPTRAGPDAVQRLAREASLTARLEHPNIVPVLGAGVSRQGQPFYTMRLLRGRTLGEAASEATPEERLGLVRHLLDAADAVAYAHGQGVLHRDLKPANIMVGEFGETLVADWGLACTREEAAAAAYDRGGTPGWMSPEQARGEPPDERVDVYALGAILYALLTGEPPPAEGPVPPVRDVRPDAPSELAAVADRALAAGPGSRYPDAAAFAADLRAWYEGRRVSAHDYTAWEIAGRFWAAYRLPLVVAALALFAVGTAVVVGYRNTVAERDRAQSARAEAEAASAAASRNLASALVAQARTAAAADRALEAELYAAHALSLAESPGARGVLSRFGGRERFRLTARRALPPCPVRAVSPDGARVGCYDDGVLTVYALDEADAVLGTLEEGLHSFAFLDQGGWLVLNRSDGGVERWRPGGTPEPIAGRPITGGVWTGAAFGGRRGISGRGGARLVDGLAPTLDTLQPCTRGRMPDVTSAEPAGSLVVGCSDGQIVRSGSPPRVLAQLTDAEGLASSLTRDLSGAARIAVGTVKGRVVVLDADSGARLATFDADTETLRTVALDGSRLAAVSIDDVVVVWDLDTGVQIGRIDALGGYPVWLDGGRRLRIVGRSLEDWEVPATRRPHRFPTRGGVSSVALSPDGARLAAATGEGRVQVFDVVDGRTLADLPLSTRVAKDVAWSADGTLLAGAASGAPLTVFDTTTWETVGTAAASGYRRVGWIDGLGFLGVPYALVLHAWRPGEARIEPAPLFDGHWWELETDARGTAFVGIGEDGDLWRGDAADPTHPRRLGDAPKAVGAAVLGADTLVGYAGRVVRLDASGAEVRSWAFDDGVVEVAVDSTGTWMAVGHASGRTSLFRADEATPRAVLEGHAGRVAAMAFSSDGAWLYTGSWDESLRAWSLADLDAPAAALRERIEAAWGQSVDDVLERAR